MKDTSRLFRLTEVLDVLAKTMSKRPFDVVMFGATGFTGKLCARYLAQKQAKQGVRACGRLVNGVLFVSLLLRLSFSLRDMLYTPMSAFTVFMLLIFYSDKLGLLCCPHF